MTVQYTLHLIHFEWDHAKALRNFEKHGISFEMACEVFFDPFVIPLDSQIAEGEVREVIAGMTTQWQLLYVVHTVRESETYRIISARRATRIERIRYEEQ